MRFEPNWRRVKQMVDEGTIGTLLHIEVQNYGDTSTLLHNGTHSCDAIRWFGGDPEWVIATVDRSDERERIMSFFELSNGVTALFMTGGHWNYRLDGCFILEGSEGKDRGSASTWLATADPALEEGQRVGSLPRGRGN